MDLRSLPDLGVYLDAGLATGVVTSGANIVQLTDLSGNARYYTSAANRPVYAVDAVDGLGVCRFNATTQLLTCISSYSPSTLTMYTQLRTGLDTGALRTLHGKGPAFGAGVSYSMDANSFALYFEGQDVSRSECAFNATGLTASTRLLALRCKSEGGNIRKDMFLDGVLKATSITTGGTGSLFTVAANAIIGARGGYDAFQCDLRRLILFGHDQTDGEMAVVNRFCDSRAGSIVFDGNSMTDGGFTTYPTECVALLNRPMVYTNVGRSGDMIQDMNRRAVLTDRPALTAHPNFCVWWEGRNALAIPTPNKYQVLADMLGYGRGRIAAGRTSVCICCPPSSGVTESDRQYVNTGLEAAGTGADRAWDIMVKESDSAALFASGAENGANYAGDHIHQSAAGKTAMATLVAGKLNPYL